MMPRPIRTFVLRSGRITPAQERALERLWPRYGLGFRPVVLDFPALFGRPAPIVLDIGFGDGAALVKQAATHPECDYLGIEVHAPGIGHCLLQAESRGLANLRLIRHDAVEVLQLQIGDRSLDRINVYFPDPWPKKRHHKRRLLQPDFLALAGSRLAPGGHLHIATDWQAYADRIDEIVAECPSFSLVERREHDGDRPLDRPATRFERRGLKLGYRISEWRLLRS
ncbi:MAG: tRNA (guanosine(46)-N7)-methyltransferase TrmB [Woeseia sp.]